MKFRFANGNRKIRNFLYFLRGWTAAVLLVQAAVVSANESKVPTSETSQPFNYKKYHVQYDVNSDGSYTELNKLELVVLGESGLRMAQQMPIGNQPMWHSSQGRSVELISAYTTKKNGENVPAAPTQAPQGFPLGSSAGMSQLQFLAFRHVEVGDVLSITYRIVQKNPVIPAHIVLDQIFPRNMVYEDVQISLNASAAIRLRSDESGVIKKQVRVDGDLQKWEWKYRNPTAEITRQNGLSAFDRIHISSFPDNNSEQESIKKLAMANPPVIVKSPRCQILPGNPNDGPNAVQALTEEVAQLFWNDEKSLKRVVDDWNSPACILDDGRPRLGVLLRGFGRAFRMAEDWSKSLARIEYLKKRFPREAFVALAEAQYWILYAWDARGGGYASTVTEEGWKAMRERMEKAEQILLETKSYSAELPGWYEAMIDVQSALNRPEQERDKLFLEGVRRYPTYYGIYFKMLGFLVPKWGGTWRTVDNMVDWSVKHTKAVEGNSMYARLYWSSWGAMEDGESPFKVSFASWTKMKRGFEDLMERNPNSKWNLNNFARFACQAGDRATFLKLRAQMGKDVVDEAWFNNLSIDLCDAKYGYAQ